MYRRNNFRQWFRRDLSYYSSDGEEESEEGMHPIPVKKRRVERPKKQKKRPAQPIVIYKNPPGEPASETVFTDMNDDCIIEILAYLDAEDLSCLSTQSRRLQNLATESFMTRFPAKVAQVHSFEENEHWMRYPEYDNHIAAFANFTKISIHNSLTNAQAILSFDQYLKAKYESRIDEIRFEGWRSLRPIHGEAFADIVDRTKTVIFSRVKIIGEFYEAILCHFPAMERLVLWNSIEMTCKVGQKKNWLLKKYPKLKHLSWFLNEEMRIDDKIKQFFKINRRIEYFSLYTTTIETLKRCVEADIDVTHLYLRINDDVDNILKYLQKNCGLMRLHLLFEDGCRSQLTATLRRLFDLKNNLEGLYFDGLPPDYRLAAVIGQCVQLKHLQIRHTDYVGPLASLPNLENLYMARGVVEINFKRNKNTIFAIATHAPKLKNIFIRNSCRPFYEFDFEQFNTYRAKLPDATKVTIHIRTKSRNRRSELATMQLHYDLFDIKTLEAEDIANPLVTHWLYEM